MSEINLDGVYKRLSPDEEKNFREWARKNYVCFTPIKGVWHPAIQEECVRMNQGQ